MRSASYGRTEAQRTLRTGATKPSCHVETRTCSAVANPKWKSVDVTFCIASKGGGDTRILVRIGVNDLPTILESLVKGMPECVTMLSEAATVAEKHLLDKLKQVTQVQEIVSTGRSYEDWDTETLHEIICSACGMPQFHPAGIDSCISCSALLKVVGV